MRSKTCVLWILALALGCASPERKGASPAERDVEPPENVTLTPLSAKVFAVVDEAPSLSVGGPDAVGPSQFSNVRGVRTRDGREIWVADGTSAEIRIFGMDGTYLRTLGGKGGGPGEFQRPRLLGAFADSTAVWDDVNPRLTVYGPDGAVARTAVPAGDGVRPQAFGVFPDGALLGQVPHVFMARDLSPGVVLGDTVRLLRFDVATGDRTTLASIPSAEWLWTGRELVPLAFSINPGFALHGELVYWTQGVESRVHVVSGAGVERVFGVERASARVGPADIEAYRDRWDALQEEQRREYLEGLDHPDRPDVLPAYDKLVCAADGSVWAERYSAGLRGPGKWDVYAPDGTWLGSATTPVGFTLDVVTADRLLGVWRDTMDVEHLRAYPWHRAGSP